MKQKKFVGNLVFSSKDSKIPVFRQTEKSTAQYKLLFRKRIHKF